MAATNAATNAPLTILISFLLFAWHLLPAPGQLFPRNYQNRRTQCASPVPPLVHVLKNQTLLG